MNAGVNHHDIIINHLVKAINEHDLDHLFPLLSPHHKLIDSCGKAISGSDVVLAWTRCFVYYPEYKIEIDNQFISNPFVALFGSARGTRIIVPFSILIEMRDSMIFTMRFFGVGNHPFSISDNSGKEPFNNKVRGFV